MPIINRGFDQALTPYFTTSDDRLIEYGFRKIIFDECSKYQRVQICSTVDYGNLLVLDGAINLAENDTEAYTNALMNLPHVSFDNLIKFLNFHTLFINKRFVLNEMFQRNASKFAILIR